VGQAIAVDVLLCAMRRVVPADVAVGAATPLDETTLDSLALLEVMVHLEDLTGRVFDEGSVRALALEPDYDPHMDVAAFATLMNRMVAEQEAAS
jgi:hypothetical protein